MSTTTTMVCAGIIGDFDPAVRAHHVIADALQHSADSLSLDIETRWLPTSCLDDASAGDDLAACDAIWCGPCGPYVNAGGALRAIRRAREEGIPFLGTCAGFQHAAIEYARTVLGLSGADHGESNPAAAERVIAPLLQPIFERTGPVMLDPGSRAAGIYGRTAAAERFRCRFGLNPEYVRPLHRAGLRVSGVDDMGCPTVIELPGHRFFIATLFMPERTSRPGAPHPLVTAYVRAAAGLD